MSMRSPLARSLARSLASFVPELTAPHQPTVNEDFSSKTYGLGQQIKAEVGKSNLGEEFEEGHFEEPLLTEILYRVRVGANDSGSVKVASVKCVRCLQASAIEILQNSDDQK